LLGIVPAVTFETVAVGLTFPEAPRWHDGALWLSDMHAHAVLRLEPAGTPATVAEVPGCPSGLGFLPDGRMLVVSMHDRRVMRLDPDGLREHADLSGLAPWHCNDMAVDANGRAYVGNFGDDSAPPAPPAPTVLIAVEPGGQARLVADELMFPNGIAVSDGGKTLVVAETRSVPGRLSAFRILPDGGLADRRVLAEFGAGELPDGIVLDAAGRPGRRRHRAHQGRERLRRGPWRAGRPGPVRLHGSELGSGGGSPAARRGGPADAGRDTRRRDRGGLIGCCLGGR
jgi:sugar lactone lactonase YvrE